MIREGISLVYGKIAKSKQNIFHWFNFSILLKNWFLNGELEKGLSVIKTKLTGQNTEHGCFNTPA